MRKNLLLIIASVATIMPMQGVVLTPEQALQRMQSEAGNLLSTRGNEPHKLLFTSYNSTGEAAVYVFDNAGIPGYIMLGADDIAAPVLGYADNGVFNPDEIPPQMKWWMEQYGRQIVYARDHGNMEYTPATRSDLQAIAPMIKTKWDQSAPYNDMCPEINGQHAVTGCVATAMAQVMKFWNYPDMGVGSATVTVGEGGTSYSMSFADQKFDWDNMLEVYGNASSYNTTQGNAVAYLMKACGYACNMQYGVNDSGASSINAAKALMNNFKYNSNIQYWSRDYFSGAAWADMIYEELASGRPVLYGGSSPTAGHEFVCDGYSSDGYFHFNWGWSGMSDGYFLLDALNPSSLGSGGGMGGGFNYGQDIIIGIQPTTSSAPTPRLVQIGNLKMTSKFNSISLSIENGDRSGLWANMGLQPLEYSLGVSIEPIDGTSGSTQYVTFSSGSVKPLEIKPGEDGMFQILYYGVTKGEITLPKNLVDGRYKMTVCSKSKNSAETDYIPVLCVSEGYNYGYFKKSGSTYTVEDLSLPELVIKDAGIVSELYYEESAKVSMTISNDSEKELTKTFYPKLSSGNQTVLTANGITVSVMPKETVTKEFSAVFELEDGITKPTGTQTYTLGFYDPETSESYKWESQVTMKFDIPVTQISISDFELTGTPSKDVQFDDGTPTKLFTVFDPSAIPFSCKVTVTQGYLGKPVYLVIFPNGGGQSLSITRFDEMPALKAGESMTLTQTLDFSQGHTGDVYIADLYMVTDGSLKPVEQARPIVFEIGDSGVDVIETSSGKINITYDNSTGMISVNSAHGVASLTVYSLDGQEQNIQREINEDSASANISHLSSGVYIVKAVDSKGKADTLKIRK